MTSLRGKAFARLCLAPSREELEAALRDCVESLEAAMEDPEADRDAMPPPALDRARLLLGRLDGAA